MEMNHHFDAFIDDLRSTHGTNLVSVILFGSTAAGDYVPKMSDHNILIALDHIGPEDLRNAYACVREWTRLGHPAPVYFTVSELKNAADVFPIEFHQMSASRAVLYGPDLLDDLKISDTFLRLQTEYELRSKLLKLRQQYIPASHTVDGLKRLMAESLSSFAALFGAALLISGKTPPAKKRDIVAMAAKEFTLDIEPFEKIFSIRKNVDEPKLDESSANGLFGEYLKQIERVIAAVDALEK
ncbi:MAG: hypothetical protein HS105_04555 [Chloracidobacterium sp.]|nr:hypothetical protein [Chloracidobacterium sp.]MCC6826303.1 hypothetical protein [Acidobacteriota bacterium]MCO5333050.1 hypothetical protein [Pyrinomonadaceae bacterium]